MDHRPAHFFSGPVLLVLTLVVGGCVTAPVELNSSFWGQSHRTIAIVTHELPSEGMLFVEGGAGILDQVVVSAATSSMRRCIRGVRPDSFLDVSDTFESELVEMDFHVVRVRSLIDLDDYRKTTAGSGEYDRDLTPLFEQTGAELILLLRLTLFGAAREYLGPLPVTDPSGMAAVEGVLVDRRGNRILWRTGNSITAALVKEPVLGEWDEPPNYPNLTAAIHRALDRSKAVLAEKFFSS